MKLYQIAYSYGGDNKGVIYARSVSFSEDAFKILDVEGKVQTYDKATEAHIRVVEDV